MGQKIINKTSRQCVLVLVFLLLVPDTFQLVHSFLKHEGIAPLSTVEKSIHQKESYCSACNLQAYPSAVLVTQIFSFFTVTAFLTKNNTYQFLSNYRQTSFLLRAPPFLTFYNTLTKKLKKYRAKKFLSQLFIGMLF